jgi:hypothetical protein
MRHFPRFTSFLAVPRFVRTHSRSLRALFSASARWLRYRPMALHRFRPLAPLPPLPRVVAVAAATRRGVVHRFRLLGLLERMGLHSVLRQSLSPSDPLSADLSICQGLAVESSIGSTRTDLGHLMSCVASMNEKINKIKMKIHPLKNAQSQPCLARKLQAGIAFSMVHILKHVT